MKIVKIRPVKTWKVQSGFQPIFDSIIVFVWNIAFKIRVVLYIWKQTYTAYAVIFDRNSKTWQFAFSRWTPWYVDTRKVDGSLGENLLHPVHAMGLWAAENVAETPRGQDGQKDRKPFYERKKNTHMYTGNNISYCVIIINIGIVTVCITVSRPVVGSYAIVCGVVASFQNETN